jgi:predicted metal-binding protein
MNDKVDLQVCVTCFGGEEQASGAVFYDALEEQVDRNKINLRPVECFSVCKRPCTLTVSQPGKWLYMIGDLNPEKDIPALFEYIRVYAQSSNGRPPLNERPEIIQKGTIARVPPDLKEEQEKDII